ncbi:unnamed protein product, partial [Closterium sp. Naga37s-1]
SQRGLLAHLPVELAISGAAARGCSGGAAGPALPLSVNDPLAPTPPTPGSQRGLLAHLPVELAVPGAAAHGCCGGAAGRALPLSVNDPLAPPPHPHQDLNEAYSHICLLNSQFLGQPHVDALDLNEAYSHICLLNSQFLGQPHVDALDLNEAYSHICLLNSQFLGQPHVDAVVALLGAHSLPMLLQFCLDSLSHKVSHQLSPLAAELLSLLPAEDLQSPFESGLPACVERISAAASALQHRAAAAVEGVIAALRDVGSLLGLLVMLDVSIAHASTLQFIQAAPWLGLLPSPSHNRLLQLLRINPSDLPPHEAFTPRGLRHRSPRHRPSHESRRETRGGETTRAESSVARAASAAAAAAVDADDDCRRGDVAMGSGADGQRMDQGRDGFSAARGGEGGIEDGQMGLPPETSLPPAAATAADCPDAAASEPDGSLLELRNRPHGSRRSDVCDKAWHGDPPQSGPPPPPAPPAAPLTDLLQRVCASVPVVRSSMLGMLQAAQVAEAIYWGSVQADSLFAHALSILSTALHPFLPLLAPPVEPWAGKRGNPREFHHLHSLLLA